MEQGIPAGYKQTEVGVIPEDWRVASVGSLDAFVTSGSRGWAAFYANRGALFVRITNLSRARIYLDLADSKFVRLPAGATEGSRTQLRACDMLISITADIGVIGYVDAGVPSPAYVNQHIALVRFDPSRVCTRFVAYFLASEIPQRIFRSITDTGAKAGLNLLTVRKIQAALPRLDEQRAIADALGDVDALLDALDRLIAKQRDLKQAAMQQLLTGRTRLPGFTGEWATRRLGDLGAAYGGLVGKTKDDFGVGDGRYIPFVNVMANTRIDVQALGRVRVGSAEIQNTVRAGDLVFNGSSETPEEVAMCAVLEADVPSLFLNSFCFGFRFFDMAAVEPLFLSYNFRADVGRALISSLAQGSTRYNISKSAFLKAAVKLPTHAEQTAIAAVLSDMDAEIAALEARRAKTRDLKQAMLQELLTGRTRLV